MAFLNGSRADFYTLRKVGGLCQKRFVRTFIELRGEYLTAQHNPFWLRRQ
jgi:hypothetical protein